MEGGENGAMAFVQVSSAEAPLHPTKLPNVTDQKAEVQQMGEEGRQQCKQRCCIEHCRCDKQEGTMRVVLSIVWVYGIIRSMAHGIGYGILYLLASVVVLVMIEKRSEQ